MPAKFDPNTQFDSLPSNPVQREFDFGLCPEPSCPAETSGPESTEPVPIPSEEELLDISRELLSSIGEPVLAKQVQVTWNVRLRTTAGRAFRNQCLVELNPALVHVTGDEVDRTLKHELAHLVAYHRARGRNIEPHGSEWQAACAELGIPGEQRCHNLDFPRVRQRRKFAYRCPNCGHEIRRVRRIRGQVACFHCCKVHNDGRFTPVFALEERRLKQDESQV